MFRPYEMRTNYSLQCRNSTFVTSKMKNWQISKLKVFTAKVPELIKEKQNKKVPAGTLRLLRLHDTPILQALLQSAAELERRGTVGVGTRWRTSVKGNPQMSWKILLKNVTENGHKS